MEFEDCIRSGGIALFPSDTVYGLACDPENEAAVARLYALKQRSRDKPSAVMFFDRERALSALPELGPRTRALLERLLPGAVTLLLPNPRQRFALACGATPNVLGLRVPNPIAPLDDVALPILQTSANVAGERDPRTLDEVAPKVRAGVDLEIDAGEVPGPASTVIDLTCFESDGAWQIVRTGSVDEASIAVALDQTWHY